MTWASFVSRTSSFFAAGLGATAAAFVLAPARIRDLDAFYHARVAALLSQGGPLDAFPWLTFTSFSARFADQHFLYHLALAALGRLTGDPLSGLFAATMIFVGLAVGVFHAGLRAQRVPSAWVFTVLLLSSTGFLYRVALGKASALAVALALAVFFLALVRRPRAIALTCAVWALSHGGWPLAVPLVGAVIAARALRKDLVRLDLSVAVAAMLGLGAGTLIHPNFPANLSFAGEQFVQIGLVGYGSVIDVGAEWSAPTLAMLWNGAGLAFATLAVTLVLRARRTVVPPASSTALLASFFAAAGLLAMTLRSYRHVEYLVPFLLVAAAFAHADRRPTSTPATNVIPAKAGIQKPVKTTNKKPSLVPSVALGLLLTLLFVRNLNGIRASFIQGGVTADRFKGTGEWLTAHAAPGDIVFHAAWDDFPPLWYHAPAQSYIAGLDPVFLYRQDPERYALWQHLIKGEQSAPISIPLKNSFRAKYILILPQDTHLANAVAFDAEHFELVHEDAEARLYELN